MIHKRYELTGSGYLAVALLAAIVCTAFNPGVAQAQESLENYSFDGVYAYYYDTDREEWLQDSDLDGTVDLTETLLGTDPTDADEFPGAETGELSGSAKSGGYPATSCRAGFVAAWNRVCISELKYDEVRYDRASVYCRSMRSHICTYEDFYYLFFMTSLDATYNPYQAWIGNLVSSDEALYGDKMITYDNDIDIGDFAGSGSMRALRAYWCCHDLE